MASSSRKGRGWPEGRRGGRRHNPSLGHQDGRVLRGESCEGRPRPALREGSGLGRRRDDAGDRRLRPPRRQARAPGRGQALDPRAHRDPALERPDMLHPHAHGPGRGRPGLPALEGEGRGRFRLRGAPRSEDRGRRAAGCREARVGGGRRGERGGAQAAREQALLHEGWDGVDQPGPPEPRHRGARGPRRPRASRAVREEPGRRAHSRLAGELRDALRGLEPHRER